MGSYRSSVCQTKIINDKLLISSNSINSCTIGRGQTAVRVVVGSVLLNSGGIVHISSRIVNHPEYNSQWISNE